MSVVALMHHKVCGTCLCLPCGLGPTAEENLNSRTVEVLSRTKDKLAGKISKTYVYQTASGFRLYTDMHQHVFTVPCSNSPTTMNWVTGRGLT